MMDSRRRGEISQRRSEALRLQVEVFALKLIVCANDEELDDSVGTDSATRPCKRPPPVGADGRLVTRAAGAAGAGRRLRRAQDPARHGDELYDDVVLHGFRHVHPQAVARRAAELVSRRQRRQIADTLDRFVAAAVENHPTPVPVHRGALIELRPQVTELSTILRTPEVELEPAGMVLLGRFISDGATSPLFKLNAHPTEVERELARIARVLNREREAA